MSFKPSIHGWAFDDSFEVRGPDVGLGAPPRSMSLGGGMCWAALDRYLDGRQIPRRTPAPEPGSALEAELRRRQVSALQGVWPRVRTWQGLPDGSWRDRVKAPLTPGRRDTASLTRREWRRIRRSLDAGRPILLTLIEPEDGYARDAAARQVLAFGWVRDAARVVLSVYDPARPGEDDVRLAFSMKGPLDAKLTGGQRVRGFFAVPYDRTPALTVAPQTFGDRSVLGLNRKVRGRPAAAAGLRVLHVVARDGDGALLHFSRRHGRHWEGANITEREEFGAHELHSDPTVLAGPFGVGLHAFARSYVGDLLHFRMQRRWRVANRTEHRRAGARFRLEGSPVPVDLPWGGACVVARGHQGTLVAYSYVPFRGWRAEEVPAAGRAVIDGDPVAVRIGPVVHVIARSREGHALHFERTSGGWSAGDLMTLCPGTGPVAERPVALVHEGRLHLAARSRDGELMHLERNAEGQWAKSVVVGGVTARPALTEGPAGLHVFAPLNGGGLAHAWRAGGRWRTEDLVSSRPEVHGDAVPSSGLVACGSDDELRLLGRRAGGGLVHWVWRRDTDWVAGPAAERFGFVRAHEPAEDPLMVVDGTGAFHLFGTDGSGTVVHLEPAPWKTPVGGRPTAPGRAAPAGIGAVRTVPKSAMAAALAAAPGRLEPEPEPPEPLPLLDDSDSTEDTLDPEESLAAADEPLLDLETSAAFGDTPEPDEGLLDLETSAGFGVTPEHDEPLLDLEPTAAEGVNTAEVYDPLLDLEDIETDVVEVREIDDSLPDLETTAAEAVVEIREIDDSLPDLETTAAEAVVEIREIDDSVPELESITSEPVEASEPAEAPPVYESLLELEDVAADDSDGSDPEESLAELEAPDTPPAAELPLPELSDPAESSPAPEPEPEPKAPRPASKKKRPAVAKPKVRAHRHIAAGLPLLDDEDEEEVEDSGADDLPLLEPMDLEEVGGLSPKPTGKKGSSSRVAANRQPPPPWPDLG